MSKPLINKLKELIDIIYPIGSVYISTNNINPSNLFGGTWSQIKDSFLLACGNIYANGSVGGEASVKLEFENYSHKVWSTDPDFINKDLSGLWNPEGYNYGYSSSYLSNRNVPHNNMPPYFAVSMWRRIG